MQGEATVMLFGVFDGLHDGHRSFIEQAQSLGEKLVIVVAQDAAVQIFKQKTPRSPLSQRVLALKDEYPEALIVPGDNEQGSWQVIKKYSPNTIALGYDQEKLKIELQKIYEGKIVTLKAHKPKELHSSFLK
jgi:cytidyltransferase-like protein